MKRLICFLLLLSSMAHWGQSNTIKLEWKTNRSATAVESQFQYPYFESKGYDLNPVNSVLKYRELLVTTTEVNPSSIQLIASNFESVSKNDLGNLAGESIESDLDLKISPITVRGQTHYVLSFNPIIREGNTFKKVVSLSYRYQSDSGGVRNRISNYTTFDTGRGTSVLESGGWYKIAVDKTGIYKITKDFLTQLGIPASVDPRTLKIYGAGGTMLSLVNQNNYETDLIENAIYVRGEEDGVFDGDDYVAFYAIGVDQWSDENLTHLNLYEDQAYYFITFGGAPGKRVGNLGQPSGSASKVWSHYDAVAFHEKDLINLGNLGRKWFGERFNINSSQRFTMSLNDLDASQPVKFNVNAASSSYGSTSFSYQVNQQSIGAVQFNRINSQSITGYESFFTRELRLSNESVVVDVQYQNGGVPTSEGVLDYIQFEYKAHLTGVRKKQFGFTNQQLAFEPGIVEYQVSNAQSIQEVWDVTDVYNIDRISNSNQSQIRFKVYGGTQRKFQTFVSSDLYEPKLTAQSRVANQNLKRTVFSEGDVDYLILTPQYLKTAADRLAAHHRTQNGLTVKVISIEEVYNEFSSGKQDVAALRNFVRYVYQNASSAEKRVRYVNLFGEASFDYKERIPNNKNVVPVFYGMDTKREVTNSAHNFSNYTTFMSDDFYALMDVGEGLMSDANYGIDLAVGRMLVGDLETANAMVAKVLEYHDKENRGRWRNNIVALADDVDRESDINLQIESNAMIDSLDLNIPFLNSKKIFLDAYVQETTAGGKRYPKAKEEFIQAIENGALYVNYLGHGGEDGLAQERVFGIEEAKKMTNSKKYPLFATITCEFTRFDNPYRETGGEAMYLNRRGGAIALVATTREIGIASGRQLNTLFTKTLFDKDGQYPTISEALVSAKNATFNRDKNVVFYIGDPAMKLAIPKPKVVLTTINDKPVAEGTEVLQALGYVKLGGRIEDENDNFMNHIDGALAVQLFDKEVMRKTRGNDGVTQNGELVVMDFKTLGETIFRGNASITKGAFAFDFVVPKDINVALGKGKLSFYATDDTWDYAGYNKEIEIGGINEHAPDDQVPPIVNLFMDNESFVSGGVTTDSPVFLAFLEDENGINTASGIGHDIVAYLDGEERNAIVLNDYYETETDNFRKGKITYPMKDLEEGLHTLTFMVWDVYNNKTSSDIQFVVTKNEGISLEKVLNYPNPFVSYTEFWFTHNRPYEPLNVQIQIMTITGKIVKTIRQTVLTEGNLSREITWDGRDDFGDRIGKGVYIYKLTVQSTLTNHQSEKIEKLVIL